MAVSVPDSLIRRVDSINAQIGYGDSTHLVYLQYIRNEQDDYKASISGSGANTVTVWAIDTSGTDAVVPYTSLAIRDSTANSLIAGAVSANNAGYYQFNLNDGTYKKMAVAVGYTFPGVQYMTVSGTTIDSVFGYNFDAGTPDSSYHCRVYGWAYDLNGKAIVGAKVEATFNKDMDKDSLFYGNIQITHLLLLQ